MNQSDIFFTKCQTPKVTRVEYHLIQIRETNKSCVIFGSDEKDLQLVNTSLTINNNSNSNFNPSFKNVSAFNRRMKEFHNLTIDTKNNLSTTKGTLDKEIE